MREIKGTENEFRSDDLSEPSLFVVSEADNIGNSFSDISIISQSDLNFIAKGIRFGKWFIIKGLNREHQTDAFAINMLRKEFDILFQIVHPNIRRAVNFEILEDLGHCIVLDYYDGPDLRTWLKEKHPVTERLKIATEIAEAISYIHSKGIVHRDIKPENIIVSRIGNTPVIIDFGLSDSDGFAILKEPGGSPLYISPEQAQSNIPDPRNDVYSFGILLKELLPENRFASAEALCLKDISKRPSDINVVKNRLNYLNSRNKVIPWITVAGISTIILTIILFSFSYFYNRSTSADLVTPNDTMPQVVITEDGNETFHTDLSPVVESQSPDLITKVNESKTATVGDKTTISEGSKNQDESHKKMTPAETYNQMLALGRKAIDYCIDENTDAKDLPMLVNVKNQYIRSLRINIHSNSSFTEQYRLENEDIDKISSELDKYIQELQRKWTTPTN